MLNILNSASLRGLAIVTAFGGVAACSATSSLSANRRTVSLSFASSSSTKTSPSVQASSFRIAPDLVVGTSNELVIKRVQVVLEAIELSHTAGATCQGGGELECEELERPPILVDIPLVAGAKTQLSVPVPEGTYSKLEADLKVPENEDGASAFLAANPDFRDKSVRVEGTYNGTPFVYTAAISAGIEMAFNPPLVVTGTSSNITVGVDVSKWFTNSSGAALDPSSSANADTIASNIRASFRAFKDDNEDGKDD